MIINLIRTLLSPYSDKVKTNYRPLEYIEVEEGKTLNIRLTDKYIFTTRLQKGLNFIHFNSSKDIIMDSLEKLNDIHDGGYKLDMTKLACYKSLIELLYEISKENYNGFFKRRKYYKFLNDLFINDVAFMIEVFTKVLAYNSELKKKLENLQNFEILTNNASDLTAGGQRLQDLIEEDPSTGEKRFKH